MSRALRRRDLILVGVALLMGACAPGPPVHSQTFFAFGTLVEVTVAGVDAEQAERAIAAVEREFHYMHEAWHPWQPGSLARVNELLATGEWFTVAPSVRPLIVAATELAEASGGRFNPAIGGLVALWGFHRDERPPGPPPAPEAIAEWVQSDPRMSDLELEGIRLRSRNPAVVLDFGAFAKGYGIDRAMELLRGLGIDNVIVNAGGDLRAMGRRGDRPWRIGVRNPRGGGVLAALEIDGDAAVFTSGDYERYFEHQGERYHHILDPATGRPARGLVSVTVVADEGARADAAATALFVAGPEEWPAVARAMAVAQVMVVDADGGVQLTPAMAARVQLAGEAEGVVVPLP